MTRDVDAIRADLAARTVGGMASSSADRDIAALLGIIDGLDARNRSTEVPQDGVQADLVPVEVPRPARRPTGRILVCATDDVCPRHGRFIYFCRECHEEWEATP